jgi:hypothetical protein
MSNYRQRMNKVDQSRLIKRIKKYLFLLHNNKLIEKAEGELEWLKPRQEICSHNGQ